jgi:hypothetical protein
MLRWILVFLLLMLLIDALGPWLKRLGVGRLPGDLNFKFLGQNWHLPFASSILLSLILAITVKFI